jgi:hypothetical protein
MMFMVCEKRVPPGRRLDCQSVRLMVAGRSRVNL